MEPSAAHLTPLPIVGQTDSKLPFLGMKSR